MTFIENLSGYLLSALGGLVAAWILYKFKLRVDQWKMLRNIPKKLDDQEQKIFRVGSKNYNLSTKKLREESEEIENKKVIKKFQDLKTAAKKSNSKKRSKTKNG